ncbi:hypothetical protein K1T71_004510 [Dendrolimus kikuchii]|uniref:Uncharacterized protein n=1 Tax=Dendrolimus kikuchii TaxID=765133 RepID=A0ACC1D857_9NEOP|nr:hypothetical protein K1T71_004510 [Dendrolimus kikuchii]
MRKTSSPCLNTGEIVLSAIKKLMKNTGWTTRTIIKFIKLEYHVGDPNIGRKVSRALKRGVRLGILQKERGRYRLNDVSRLARPVSAREIRTRQKSRKGERYGKTYLRSTKRIKKQRTTVTMSDS